MSFASDTAWKIVAEDDYDGDGKADMLYHHEGNGHMGGVRTGEH